MQNLELIGSTKSLPQQPQPNSLNNFNEVKRSNEEPTDFNQSFPFMTNSVRKTSLSDETCSTHSSSSRVSPPWSSSSVSHSPTPVEQVSTKPTLTSNNRPKSFHNILNLINNKEENETEQTRDEEGFDSQPPSVFQPPFPSHFDESIR